MVGLATFSMRSESGLVPAIRCATLIPIFNTSRSLRLHENERHPIEGELTEREVKDIWIDGRCNESVGATDVLGERNG